MANKKSFFERLTGAAQVEDEEVLEIPNGKAKPTKGRDNGWIEENTEEGELTVDVHQTPDEIIIKTMVAGVKPEDLDISISRDMVTIKGHREESQQVADEDYYHRELYWGSFSRTIMLPQEIDVDGAEATEKYGLLTLKLPKTDKGRQTKIKVKSN